MRWILWLGELTALVTIRQALRQVSVGPIAPWQESLLLVPLALPRAAEFFYEATNIDWILLALAAGGILLAMRGRWLLAGIVLGVGMATKQPFVLVPGLFLLSLLRPRSVAVAIGTAALITVPFLVQDPLHVSQILLDRSAVLGPGQYHDRITIWSMLWHLGLQVGDRAESILFALALLAAGALALVFGRSLPQSLMACGVAQFLLSLGAPFSGYNYFVFGIAFFAWGLALRGTAEPSRSEDALPLALRLDRPRPPQQRVRRHDHDQ
jgi:hypothetical protein